jgi:hypothetical protein
MKGVFIKWRRGDQYEKRGDRRAAVRNAHRTIRQQSRVQLHRYCFRIYSEFDPDFVEGDRDYCNDYIHPSVRLGYFD